MKYIKKFNDHSNYETFIDSEDYITPNVSICIQQSEVHYNPLIPHDYSQDYLTFKALEDGTFQFTKAINYSIDDGTTWTELAANTATPIITRGNKIIWKAELTPSSSSPHGIGTFSSTCNFNIEGNAMSLLYGDNFIGQNSLKYKKYAFCQLFYNCLKLINAEHLLLPATTLAVNCYEYMFYGCTSLITAPELPATTLENYCYQLMFENCTALKVAPNLPATTLAYYCYYGMFHYCTSLTTAQELPATTLSINCYQCMFDGCTSLTTAPELPATTLANNCYTNMFNGCISLTTAPELPATTLKKYCYERMFQGCTSLTTTPELPATTLIDYCYTEMFKGCTSLTTATELPATTLVNYCYQGMFNGCTNLKYIKAMFTTTPSNIYTRDWVSGVSATGTFVKNSTAEWDLTGINAVPSGWTVQTAIAA